MQTIALSEFEIDEHFFAHTTKTKDPETLIAHSHLTLEYYHKLVHVKSLDTLIETLSNTIDKEESSFIKEMFISSIYLHDIGKINPSFQAKKMKNPLFYEYSTSTKSSNHSELSADNYIDYYLEKINQNSSRRIQIKLTYILYSFSYHQAKHHGKLKSFKEYKKDDIKVKSYFQHLEKLSIPYFEFYILNKLLFSLLISSDYYATTEYMANLKTEDFGLFDKDILLTLRVKFDKYISSFKEAKGINVLRNELFKESETNLLQNLDKHIFYLEAPTGSGKTITSINLALKLLESDSKLNKLFYVFPFNTLVEQTKNVFDEIFEKELSIEIINSISPISEKKQEEKESEYQKSYINRLFFHSPAIITTHVSLFNILFGTSKEDNFALWQLANSVIIIDEIQSYNNHLWWYMVDFFDKYASLLNIKIIIMSATLPKLDFFLEKKSNFVDLISKEKRNEFFTHTLFKNRVIPDFSLLRDKKMDFDTLENILEIHHHNYQKILFEFIKKQTAREFYNSIKEKYTNVFELSGDDNKAYRQHVINETKANRPIIVIATQVIEAGVDIDMDLGFKDISTLDSEEQFMGRINRSCKKTASKVYFFDLDDARVIYKDDNRLGFDLKQEKYQKILQNKEYSLYYEEVLKRIQAKGKSYNRGLSTNYENFEEALKVLDYKAISETMTLINSQNFTLYFPFCMDISLFKDVKEFQNIDDKYLSDGSLDGVKVWNEFIQLHDINNFLSYPKKVVKKSQLNALMQFFTFNLIKFSESQRPYVGELIHGFYFVEKYEMFITPEYKFDREAYNSLGNRAFL